MRSLFPVMTVINLTVHKIFSIDASLYAHFVFGAFDQDHNGVINFEVWKIEIGLRDCSIEYVIVALWNVNLACSTLG